MQLSLKDCQLIFWIKNKQRELSPMLLPRLLTQLVTKWECFGITVDCLVFKILLLLKRWWPFWETIFIYIPFGKMLLVHGDVYHSGHYGCPNKKCFHAYLRIGKPMQIMSEPPVPEESQVLETAPANTILVSTVNPKKKTILDPNSFNIQLSDQIQVVDGTAPPVCLWHRREHGSTGMVN